MTPIGFLILLLVAAVAGLLGQALAGFSLGGLFTSIVVGFVGAFIGTWLAREFNLPFFFTVNVEGQNFPIVWAVLGGAIFTAVIGLLQGGRRRRRY